jgi:hypothetical protein
MPRDGSGVYSTPPGTHGTPNTTILSANYNSNVDDVAADLNTPRPIVAGGTGATTAAGALTALGAVAKAGDTMTGLLVLSADPSAALGAATRQYADTKVAKAGDTMTGSLTCPIVNATTYLSTNNAGAGLIWFGGGSYNIAFSGTTFSTNGNWKFNAGNAPVGSASVGLALGFAGGVAQYGMSMRPVADNTFAMLFRNAADSDVGTISITSTTTSYATSSDDRLKENLKSFDAGNIIDNTNVYDFAWRTTGERAYGVIAQEAIDVYPMAVSHNEDIDFWGVDYSKYVPVLLQELKALRARVAMLEGDFSGKPT